MGSDDAGIRIHDEHAGGYDEQCIEYNWRGPEVLFGLSHEYISAGDSILAIGVGTGLCAAPYARAGLAVSGIDGSEAMLDVCRSKGIALHLACHDLADAPWPCADGSFNHAVACGIMHFFGDLNPFMAETARLLKPRGVFVFNTMPLIPEDNPPEETAGEAYREVMSPEGVKVFMHSDEYISRLLDSHGMRLTKSMRFLMRGWQRDGQDLVIGAFTAVKE